MFFARILWSTLFVIVIKGWLCHATSPLLNTVANLAPEILVPSPTLTTDNPLTNQLQAFGPMLPPPYNDYDIDTIILVPSRYTDQVTQNSTCDYFICLTTSDNTFWWEYADILVSNQTADHILFDSTLLGPSCSSPNWQNAFRQILYNSYSVLYLLIPPHNVTTYSSFMFNSKQLFWSAAKVSWASIPAFMMEDLRRPLTWELQSCFNMVFLLLNPPNSSYSALIQLLDIQLASTTNFVATVNSLKGPGFHSASGTACYMSGTNSYLYGLSSSGDQLFGYNPSTGNVPLISHLCSKFVYFCNSNFPLARITLSQSFNVLPWICSGATCVEFSIHNGSATISNSQSFQGGQVSIAHTFAYVDGSGSTEILDASGGIFEFGFDSATSYQYLAYFPRLSYTDLANTGQVFSEYPLIDGVAYALGCYNVKIGSGVTCPKAIMKSYHPSSNKYGFYSITNGNIFFTPSTIGLGVIELSSSFLYTVASVSSVPLTCILAAPYVGSINALCPALRRYINLGVAPNLPPHLPGDLYYDSSLSTTPPNTMLIRATSSSWQPIIVGRLKFTALSNSIVFSTQSCFSSILMSSESFFLWKDKMIRVFGQIKQAGSQKESIYFSMACPVDTNATQCQQRCFNTSNTLLPMYFGPLIQATLLSDDIVFLYGNSSGASSNIRSNQITLINILHGQVQNIAVNVLEKSSFTGGAVFVPTTQQLLQVSQQTFQNLNELMYTAVTLSCPVGYFAAPGSGAPFKSLCTLCARGSYSSIVGSVSCTQCPKAITTAMNGSVALTDCMMCEDDYCHNNGVCFVINYLPNCQCKFGYLEADQCDVPWIFISIPLIIVMTIVLMGVFKVARRKYKAILEIKEEHGQLMKSWYIKWSDLSEINLKPLGTGGYGEVFSAVWGGHKVAVKFLHETLCSEILHEFEEESKRLMTLRSPYIVLLMGIGKNPEHRSFIMTELIEQGSLRAVLDLSDQRNISWQTKLRMAVDMSTGLEFLHSQTPRIIHRDIKSLNVFVSAIYRCKIGDFGSARLLTKTSTNTSKAKMRKELKQRKPVCYRTDNDLTESLLTEDSDNVENGFAMQVTGDFGSFLWKAPEIFSKSSGQSYYTTSIDVFALGIIFWELATNGNPYDHFVNNLPECGRQLKLEKYILSGKGARRFEVRVKGDSI